MRVNIIFIVLFTLVLFCSDRLLGQCQLVQDEVNTYLYTDQDFGQSLVFCETGRLLQLDLHAHDFLTGQIQAQLSIYVGEGYQGQQIHTETIILDDSWASIYTHVFGDTISVQQDSLYTFRIDYSGDFGAVWVDFTDVYENGDFIWNGEIQENVDMGFSAYIVPLEDPTCIYWTGAVDQDWENEQNWTPTEIPDSSDCVIIGEVENAQFPLISTLATSGDLVIEQGAALTLLGGAELRIFGNLDSYGQSEFLGKVILEECSSDSEVNGSPVFEHLILKGVYFATEPLEILEILDLSEGYLVNLGTELYLNSGNGHLGHAYVPEDVIQGPVIIKRQIEYFGEQILGLPFETMTDSILRKENSLADVLTFDHTESIVSFSDNWSVSDDYSSMGSSDAIRTYAAEAVIFLEGQTTNEDLIINGKGIVDQASESLQLIANPFPSVIDIDQLDWIGPSCTAVYKWIPEKQQFGSRISTLTTHDMGSFLLPSEAVIVELNKGEQLHFNYDQVVVEPNEIVEIVDESWDSYHLIMLGVEGEGGSDEFIIRLDNESSEFREDNLDALKIPSLNRRVPTAGTVNSAGDVLSINTMPPLEQGITIPLYIDPGASDSLSLSPLNVDISDLYESLLLVDLKLDVYHDLIELGTYHTVMDPEDGPDRFLLKVGEVLVENSPGLEEYELPQDGGNESDWSVYAVENELVVTSPFPGFGSITFLSLYSPDGKVIYSQELDFMEDEWRRTLHVESGIYLIVISNGTEQITKKVWLD